MLNFEKDIKGKSFFICGPCVMESYELLEEVAQKLVSIKKNTGVEIIFKSSFDKANRTSVSSFRGIGLELGKKWLGDIKEKYNLPVTTDVHESYQPPLLADVVDIMQIPAYLCRQTDLLVASAKTGRIVNIKKGQFLSGSDMKFAAQKVAENDNNQIILTERGNMFGYNNLIVDYRNLPEMKKLGYPVMMDCTHSVQRPGGDGGTTGGNREFIPQVAKAAKIFGADGFFLEVHPNPPKALSDSTNQLYLADLENLIKEIMAIPA